MNSFIDTHTHLFCEEFNADRDAAVERAVAAGVERLCLPSINRSSLAPLLEMCNRHKGVCYPMIGLHPTDVDANYCDELQEMEKMLLAEKRFIAVGEVGLDFYWSEEFRDEQFAALEAQIDWAKRYSLPLVIHSRNAFKELADVMENHRSAGLIGVFHCFSGNEAEAQVLLSHEGFFLGVGGVLTYKNSTLRNVLASVPLERLVLETDSPYLTPVPHRGKRNESAYVPHIAAALAAVYGCTVERVAQVTTENALRLFPKMAAGEKV